MANSAIVAYPFQGIDSDDASILVKEYSPNIGVDAEAIPKNWMLGALAYRDSLTAKEIGAASADLLDSSGVVKAEFLPSYVDDVLTYTSYNLLPTIGETGKIYLVEDTNRQYRYTLAGYVDISSKVESVNGKTGVIVISKADIDLGNVNNTSDIDKPISTATQTALDTKVSLSKYLAEVTPAWKFGALAFRDTIAYGEIGGTPTIPAAQIQSNWIETDTASLAYINNKPVLKSIATSGLYSDLTGVPSVATTSVNGLLAATDKIKLNNLSGVNSGDQDLSGYTKTWALGALAFRDSLTYSELSNPPVIPASQIQSDWTQVTDTALDYIKNKPEILPAWKLGALAYRDSLSYTELSNQLDTSSFLTSISTIAYSQITTGTIANTIAKGDHTHGNITTDGKLGSTSGLILTTGANGVITTLSSGSSGQVLTFSGTSASWANLPGTSVSISNDTASISAIPVMLGTTSAGTATLYSTSNVTIVPNTGKLTAGALVKSGGTSSQFLKADGSVDSSSYITGITSTNVVGAMGLTTTTGFLKYVGSNSWAIDTNTYLTSVAYGTTASTACVGNDARLSDARTPTSHALTSHTATCTTGQLLVATGTNTFGFGSAATLTIGTSGGTTTYNATGAASVTTPVFTSIGIATTGGDSVFSASSASTVEFGGIFHVTQSIKSNLGRYYFGGTLTSSSNNLIAGAYGLWIDSGNSNRLTYTVGGATATHNAIAYTGDSIAYTQVSGIVGTTASTIAAGNHTHSGYLSSSTTYAGSSVAGGAATSAAKLTSAVTINGISFDGSANITIPLDFTGAVLDGTNRKVFKTSTANMYTRVGAAPNGTDTSGGGFVAYATTSITADRVSLGWRNSSTAELVVEGFTTGNGNLAIGNTNKTNAIYIDGSTGYVGIFGQTSPSTALDVNGTIKATGFSGLPTASTTTSGIVKLGSDTVQTTGANTVSSTSSRSYAVQVNSSAQLVVNVPWTDTTYTFASGTTQGAFSVTPSGGTAISVSIYGLAAAAYASIGTGATQVAAGNHTHTGYLASTTTYAGSSTTGGDATAATVAKAIPTTSGAGTGSGKIYVDTTTNRLYIHNGTAWKYVALI